MSGLGQPLMSGAEQADIGLKVFDVVAVPTEFMNQHPETVQAFMDVIEATNQQWRKNPDPMRAAIARAANMAAEGSNQTLSGFSFPSAAEQKTEAWMGAQVANYSKEVADFFVTHGRLAEEFIAALEHIVGPQRNVCSVCIGAEDDMERRRTEILDCIAGVDDGDGVAVLTDMFGGTPSNLAISIMDQAKVDVIAGLNLPMLIRLASIRETCTLAEAIASAQEAGRKYINVASTLLSVERT